MRTIIKSTDKQEAMSWKNGFQIYQHCLMFKFVLFRPLRIIIQNQQIVFTVAHNKFSILHCDITTLLRWTLTFDYTGTGFFLNQLLNMHILLRSRVALQLTLLLYFSAQMYSLKHGFLKSIVHYQLMHLLLYSSPIQICSNI